MKVLTNKINEILKKKNLTYYQLSKLIDFDESALNKMIKGKISISDNLIKKLVPILEIPDYKIKGWIIADKYSKETLQRAIELKREYDGQDKLIFTIKMHELMGQHNLTINPFSRVIGYNQGWLSQVVLGKEPVSKKLMQKLCVFSGLPEDEITSWVVADKYSADTLRTAVGC